MKPQKFKVVFESTEKLTPEQLLEIIQKNVAKIASLSVINWDTKEATGYYELD